MNKCTNCIHKKCTIFGKKKYLKKTFELYQKAANKGSAKGYYHLFFCYKNGEMVE